MRIHPWPSSYTCRFSPSKHHGCMQSADVCPLTSAYMSKSQGMTLTYLVWQYQAQGELSIRDIGVSSTE